MQPSERTGSAEWIRASKAPERYNRPERTISKWVKNGEIRKMRPLQETWLFMPDLERMDEKTQRRKPRAAT